ncbi:MAG: hypothetical protein ACE5G1_17555, partial [bacterium]
PPRTEDLLTEASLPVDQMALQRRYSEIERFNTFLPPTGKFILPGPNVKKLPTAAAGLYMVLLRIEASDDKEGDSNLGVVGGSGVVHSGAVAGFPIPPFRYYVGNSKSDLMIEKEGELQLLLPGENVSLAFAQPVDFSWTEVKQAALYRLEARDSRGEMVLSAIQQPGVAVYRAPSWLPEKLADGEIRWRVSALNYSGKVIQESPWRNLKFVDKP